MRVGEIESINGTRATMRMRSGVDPENAPVDLQNLDPDNVIAFFSCDDKAKISTGAPGHPISTKVKHRGRCLAPVDEDSAAGANHGLVE
eukprot:COSAG01_NODE_53153_length_341_cov_0.809917_1_plen_88_part_01